jgi:hypothetical protein
MAAIPPVMITVAAPVIIDPLLVFARARRMIFSFSPPPAGGRQASRHTNFSFAVFPPLSCKKR